jgi:ParB-like chromosome segregation protein Spo0J
MQSNLEAHSAAAMFPMMSADELQALAADIEAHGLVEPVVLFEGKILDGRNRVKACELAGVRVDTVAWVPQDQRTPIEFVISANLYRRHLSTSQRAIIAATDVLPKLEAEAKVNQAHGSTARGVTLGQKVDQASREPRASDRAAELLGTNRQYVSDAKKIADTAPDLVDKIKSGELTIRDAKTEAKLKVDAADCKKDGLWGDAELAKRNQLLAGTAVVINMKSERLLKTWADGEGLLVRVDRKSKWGNPFELPDDGSRDDVCNHYRDHYFPHKPSLSDVSGLRGKALGCWCSPDRCHADHLADLANQS